MLENQVDWLKSIKESGVETTDNDIRLLHASIMLSILHELKTLNDYLTKDEVEA